MNVDAGDNSVSKNCTTTQVQPWRFLARETPRKGSHFPDKLSETIRFWDNLSAAGGWLVRGRLVGSNGESLTRGSSGVLGRNRLFRFDKEAIQRRQHDQGQ